MKRIKWYLDTGFGRNCRYEGEIEIEDNATEDEIEAEVKEEAFNCISWGWKEAKVDE